MAWARTAIVGVPTIAQAKTLVALDVHVSGTVAAIIDRGSGELRRQRLSGRAVEVCEFVAGLEGPVRATYEAGPTGFALARRLQAAGVDCWSAPRGLILRGSSDRVKTDQRDAERLVRVLIAGELHRVTVPSVAAEGLRDLVRAREDLRGDLMSARHRVSKLLLRHDVRFDGTQRNWTQPHLRWLSTVRFDQPGTQVAFDDYRGAVEALLIRRGDLERQIAEQLPISPWAQSAQRLMCLRGIDTLTAAGLCAEIGDFDRFRHPEQLMSYLSAELGVVVDLAVVRDPAARLVGHRLVTGARRVDDAQPAVAEADVPALVGPDAVVVPARDARSGRSSPPAVRRGRGSAPAQVDCTADAAHGQSRYNARPGAWFRLSF